MQTFNSPLFTEILLIMIMIGIYRDKQKKNEKEIIFVVLFLVYFGHLKIQFLLCTVHNCKQIEYWQLNLGCPNLFVRLLQILFPSHSFCLPLQQKLACKTTKQLRCLQSQVFQKLYVNITYIYICLCIYLPIRLSVFLSIYL